MITSVRFIHSAVRGSSTVRLHQEAKSIEAGEVGSIVGVFVEAKGCRFFVPHSNIAEMTIEAAPEAKPTPTKAPKK